jgi:hypothetical protein
LDKAARLFHSWLSSEPTDSTYCWRIEPVHDSLAQSGVVWEVHPPNGAAILRREQSAQALLTVEFLAVQALTEHPRGLLSLHGALVAKNGNGIVILGAGKAGKSTLACALWRRGWSLLCDDMALVETERGRARPTPRRVSLRAPSRVLLGEELWSRMLVSPSCDQTLEGYAFHPHEVDGKPQLKETRLVATIFLERPGSGAVPVVARKLEPARALLALLPYSNVARVHDFGEAIRRIRPLAATVPVYDLGRGPLADMVKSVEAVFAEAI